eukprot:CAMPEP_0116018336 /NCGR_PEP_ID=MMETSP0321-20121206/8588_1 /TAXON_ID=163516 /ORGANISM="Leptocylindrus danicus var. danicus, Strain B650" /LENGTH=179 /DNA_ID=CAMNT_0003488711 /DNA_START=68 /DNA_END=607 /DNA_ORIENTATION=-
MISRIAASVFALFLLAVGQSFAWQSPMSSPIRLASSYSITRSSCILRASELKEKSVVNDEVEETVEKYGLEAGLFQSMKKEDGGASAKDLLKKYGIAYLATSIPLAYLLVDNGVDVSALLGKVGIEVSGTSETVGTAAIAYAAHKAASPIRFPPTVLLTPVVAKLIGKEPEEEEIVASE